MCWHAGRLLVLKEDSQPMEIDPLTLETRGTFDFGGALTSKTFTAHPKIDPVSGEMVAFAYNTQGQASKDISLFYISRDGELVRTESFEAPYASMVHDFHLSQKYIAFTLYPMINDWDRVKRGEPFFHWDSTLPTVVAVIPRAEGVRGIRWYTYPGIGMSTHSFNSWDDGSVLHMEQFFTGSGWLSQFPDIRDPAAKELPPFAKRWSFDLASPSEQFAIEPIFEQIGEMPMIDPRFLSLRANQYFFGTINTALGPMLEWGPKGPPFTCIAHHDAVRRTTSFYYAGPNSAPEEPYIVPKSPTAPEGDGWLLTVVGRRAENRTDLVILDSRDLAAGPVATIRLPCRIHEGFHGTWLPIDELPGRASRATPVR
jgi:carotenoid cleavage dioxygenase